MPPVSFPRDAKLLTDIPSEVAYLPLVLDRLSLSHSRLIRHEAFSKGISVRVNLCLISTQPRCCHCYSSRQLIIGNLGHSAAPC